MLKSPISGLGDDGMTPTTYVNNFHVKAHKKIIPQETQPTGESTHRKIIPHENYPDGFIPNENHPPSNENPTEKSLHRKIIPQGNHATGKWSNEYYLTGE